MLALIVLGVIVLRHDFWWWNTPDPLLFGFLPVGLWWQAGVSILASITMWLLVRFAWPGRLEDEALEAERRRLAASPAKQGAAAGPRPFPDESGDGDAAARTQARPKTP